LNLFVLFSSYVYVKAKLNAQELEIEVLKLPKDVWFQYVENKAASDEAQKTTASNIEKNAELIQETQLHVATGQQTILARPSPICKIKPPLNAFKLSSKMSFGITGKKIKE
jgi:hypothetical protein